MEEGGGRRESYKRVFEEPVSSQSPVLFVFGRSARS